MNRLWKVIWSGHSSRAAIMFILLLVLVGLCSEVIAPHGGGGLIPFGPNEISEGTSSFLPPGTTEASGRIHYLGTDQIGRDVAARIVHGSGTVLQIGIFSTLISFLIAVLLGILSGYFGDRFLKVNLLQLVAAVITMWLGWFYARHWSLMIDDSGVIKLNTWRFLALLSAAMSITYLVTRRMQMTSLRRFFVPLDFFVLKFIEVFKAIPALFFILAMLSIFSRPSKTNVIIIIGILGWPLMTRLLRAEIMNIKQSNFVKAAKVIGLSDFRILMAHVLPGALSPLVVAFAFSVSASILVESTLSFLNIGLPQNEPSWGNVLSAARQYLAAWWMAVVPGMLIFVTVLAFNAIGDRINGTLRNN